MAWNTFGLITYLFLSLYLSSWQSPACMWDRLQRRAEWNQSSSDTAPWLDSEWPSSHWWVSMVRLMLLVSVLDTQTEPGLHFDNMLTLGMCGKIKSSFENAFCIYLGYVILTSVWWSESFKSDKYGKIKHPEERNSFSQLSTYFEYICRDRMVMWLRINMSTIIRTCRQNRLQWISLRPVVS